MNGAHLQWWLQDDNVLTGQPLHPIKHALQSFTDASKEGWGAHLNKCTARGTWSLPESKLHINYLELKAVFLALRVPRPLHTQDSTCRDRQHHSGVIHKQGRGHEVGPTLCSTMENLDLVHQKSSNSQSPTHSRPDHPNRVVSPSRGLPSNMQQVAPASYLFAMRFNNKLPLFVSPVPDSLATAVDALSLPWENLDAYAFPPAAILGKVVEKLQDSPCKRIILIFSGWPNMPWFWDLVTMSSQIPLSLPFLPNLLTQPFNQIPHRNPTNQNLHAWLLEPHQSRSRASLKQWQQELRLLKEDQPDQSMRQSGPFLQSGASLIRWTSGHPLADFLMYLMDRKLQPSTINGYRSAIVDKLGNSPFNISKDKNFTCLLDSFHRDRPKGRRGILSLVLYQLTRASFEPIKESSLKHLTFKKFSSWPLGRASAEVRFMLGKTGILDTNLIGQRCPCIHHPAFFPRISWPKRVQTVWSQWLYQPWPPTLDRSLESDRSLFLVRSLRYYLDRTSDLRQNKEVVFVSFKKGFDKDISPASVSSWIKQTVILYHEL